MKYLFLVFSLLFFACEDKEEIARLAEVKRLTDSTAVADSLAQLEAVSPKWKHTELMPGEGVFQVLERLDLDHKLIMDVINKLRFNVELVSLRAGERFSAKYSADTTQLLEFHYMPNRISTHKIFINADSLSYQKEEKQTITKRRMIHGSLGENSTLNQSLLDAGFSHYITQVVNGILLCKISFRTDARVGDAFSVLLHEEFYNDTLIPSRTKVLYTAYSGVRSGAHEAYRYQDDDPKSTYNAHYTPTGEALIHSGLRYPVDRLHISSSYGMRRHPVTGGRKMHSGIDYAGPTGTPIYAVAPGKVVISGYDKYSGNKIAIRHADRSTSYYLHLSKRLARVGQQVRSRQLIGKMGATGRVTGPHLHFGFKKPNGKWMNPNRKRMIATPKLQGKRLAKLQKQMESINSTRSQLEAEGKAITVKPKVKDTTLIDSLPSK